MMLLRDIPLQYAALVEEYNSDCTDERREQIERELFTLDDNFSTLCQNLASLQGSYLAEVEAYKKEIDRLGEKLFRANRNAEWIDNYLAQCIKGKGLDKLNTELYKFSFRKSSAVIVTNTEALAEEFRRTIVRVEPDKKAIGEAIKSGQIVEGAYVEERRNLQIK